MEDGGRGVGSPQREETLQTFQPLRPSLSWESRARTGNKKKIKGEKNYGDEAYEPSAVKDVY